MLVGTKLAQHLLEGRVPVLEEPAVAARASGARTGALAARALAARAGAKALAGRARDLFVRDHAGAGPSRPAIGPRSTDRPRFARRRRSIAPRPCAGWSGRPRAWGSSGPSLISRIGWAGCTWSGAASWRRSSRTRRSGWCRSWARPKGMYGFLQPGHGPGLGPLAGRLARGPVDGGLAQAGACLPPQRQPTPAFERIALVPDRSFLFGTMMGGAGAFLALGSLALPLALAIVLARDLAARQPRKPVVPAPAYGAGGPGRSAGGHACREHVPGRLDGRALVLLAIRRGAGGGGPSRRGGLALAVDRPDESAFRVRLVWARRSLSSGRSSWEASRRSQPSRGNSPGSSGPRACRSCATSPWWARDWAVSLRFIPM